MPFLDKIRDRKYYSHILWAGVSVGLLFAGTYIGKSSSEPSYLDLIEKQPQVRTGYLEKGNENKPLHLLVELRDGNEEVLRSKDGKHFRNIEDITQEQNQELIDNLKQKSIIESIPE